MEKAHFSDVREVSIYNRLEVEGFIHGLIQITNYELNISFRARKAYHFATLLIKLNFLRLLVLKHFDFTFFLHSLDDFKIDFIYLNETI